MLSDSPVRSIDTWRGEFTSVTLDQETIKPASLQFRHYAQPRRHVGSSIGDPIYRASDDSEYSVVQLTNKVELWPPANFASIDSDMHLGADFLLAHRTLLAFSQGKVYFSYQPGTHFLAD